jgi:hypothetical protein
MFFKQILTILVISPFVMATLCRIVAVRLGSVPLAFEIRIVQVSDGR